jgi:arylsulfatase A-like enzyme
VRPLSLLLPALLALCAACSRPPADPAGAWQRIDLWLEPPQVESIERAPRAGRPFAKRIAFLGAAEVRDMSKVPPQQLIAFPRRTAGQVRAIEQQPDSRLTWRLRLPREPYFSFVPLGSEGVCACTYRMGVRAGGKIEELYRVAVEPVAPIARATAEVDLSPWAGQEVDLLLQIDGPKNPPAEGPPLPPVLWGSPAVYGRGRPVARHRQAHPNVLLIGIDTLRADRVGAFRREERAGRGKLSLTPSLDRLAGESDVFLDAYSVFNVTNPSFLSIMTGLYGKHHGIYDLRTRLPAGHTTLADLFARAGYDTMAIISARHLGDHNSGIGQGFKDVTEPTEHFAAELAADMAMDWIAGHDRDARAQGAAGQSHPFFAWVHLFDPHTPHTPPDPFALGLRPAGPEGLRMVPAWVVFRPPGPRPFTEAVLGANLDLYDGEVAYTDRQIGRLLDFLDSRGLGDDTIVAVVADHGENVGDHGVLFRHLGLFESTTHVPLMIRWPAELGGHAGGGRRIAGLVETIDLFPTLLGAAGVRVPPSDGVDLRRLPTGGKRAVFAEHAERLGVSVRNRGYRYMLSQGNSRFFPDGPYLFDEAADPEEKVNLVGKGRPEERQLDDLLKRWLADRGDRGRGPAPKKQDLSDEDAKRLKSLGYN